MRGNHGDTSEREPARRRKPARRLRNLDRLDSETPESIFASTPAWDGGGSAPLVPHNRRRRRLRVNRRLVVLVVTVLAGLLWLRTYAAESLPQSVQILIGRETRQPTSPHIYTDGNHSFMATQPGNPQEPVGYNPCHPIKVAINYRDAPPDAVDLVQTTITHINVVSGLHLILSGASQDRPSSTRVGPVLVAWSNTTEDPDLKGAVGVGGSSSYSTNYGTKYYVSGVVALDAAVFNKMPHAQQQAVLDHEFGHVVGLGHVDDTGQLMSAHGQGRTTFGHGDLTGLAMLGKLPCR